MAVDTSAAEGCVRVAVEPSAAEDWVGPGVFCESAAGESRRAYAFHREGLRLTSLARGAPSRAYQVHITATAAAVLTAVLPSALAKAANMEPVRFASVASAV